MKQAVSLLYNSFKMFIPTLNQAKVKIIYSKGPIPEGPCWVCICVPEGPCWVCSSSFDEKCTSAGAPDPGDVDCGLKVKLCAPDPRVVKR